MKKRLLILEDGTVYEGQAIGADVDTTGEILFTTAQTGYQEIITNLSYSEQIIVFSAPSIGNTGINRDDYEAIYPTIKGVVVHEAVDQPSHYQSQMSLHEFLTRNKIPGISGIDTRELIQHIRKAGGAMKATLALPGDEMAHLHSQLVATVLQKRLAQKVSTRNPYPAPGAGRKIVIIDLGIKHSILRELSQRNANVIVVPHTTTAREIMDLVPDGVIISNGPGTAVELTNVIATVKALLPQIPILGIGLGHQVFGLVNGAKVIKLPIGHHANEVPILEVASGSVLYTSQNHGFETVFDFEKNKNVYLTHINLVDGSVEGIRSRQYPAFSVQFQPEGAPGSRDADYIFDDFLELIDEHQRKQSQEGVW
jgi:carbamoyl-phosphate synthase small subunit